MKKLLILVAATFGLTSGATAATTFFTDVNAFNAATAAIDLTLNTFDTDESASRLPNRLADPNFFNVVRTAIDFNTGLFFSDNPELNNVRNPTGRGILTGQTSTRPFSFTFNEAITAFAIDLFDFGNLASRNLLTITLSNGVSEQIFDIPRTAPSNQLFAGLVSDTAFTSVTFQSSVSGDNINFDNLRTNTPTAVTAVPEPATWLMMIFGFGLIAVQVKRRRNQSALNFI